LATPAPRPALPAGASPGCASTWPSAGPARHDPWAAGGTAAQAGTGTTLSDDDASYVARLISQRGDISTDEAKQKVKQTFEQVQQQIEKAKQAAKDAEEKAKQAAEQARKATAYSLLWMFVVLLAGAFVGSLSATWGGRQRHQD